MDALTLAHTTWNCKYHIVFAPKFRRQIIYGKYKIESGHCAIGKELKSSKLIYAPTTFICYLAYLQNSAFRTSWAISKARVLS